MEPAILTLRNDPDIEAALRELGATDGNRSKVIKQAIMLAAVLRKKEVLPDTVLMQIREDLARIDSALADYLGVPA